MLKIFLTYTNSMNNVNNNINELNATLSEIRQVNDQIQQQQAQKGAVDPLTQAKFQKLEQRLERIKAGLAAIKIETAGLKSK